MEAFKPYVVVSQTADTLQLSEPKWRKRVYFVVFRILPFFFAFQVILLAVASRNEPEIPAVVIYSVAAITLIPASILLSRSYTTEIEISALAVVLKRNSLFGRKEETIAVADIDSILCKRRTGKGGGFFYYLKYKSKQSNQKLLSIPSFFMNPSNRAGINENLEKITGLTVDFLKQS